MRHILYIVLAFAILGGCKKDDDKSGEGTLTAAISVHLPESWNYTSYLDGKATVKLLQNGITVSTMYTEAKENVSFGVQKYGDYTIKVTGKRKTYYDSGSVTSSDLNQETKFTLAEENKNVTVEVW